MIRSRAIACLLLIFGAACATAGAKGNGSGMTEPQLLRRASMPPMHFTTVDAAVPLVADIAVVIDSTGAPIMSTFKATGSAATENQFALYQYVQNSEFKPAVQDGHPVSGVYHAHMQFRVVAHP